MTVEEKKERNRKYGAICARAKAMGIMQGDAISAIMDIESADRKFNLRLDDFLGADNSNFAHTTEFTDNSEKTVIVEITNITELDGKEIARKTTKRVVKNVTKDQKSKQKAKGAA